MTGCRPVGWGVGNASETVLLGLFDALAVGLSRPAEGLACGAEAASSTHRRGASERGFLGLLDEVGINLVHEARTLAEGEVSVAVKISGKKEKADEDQS